MSLINKMLQDLETRQNTPLGKPSSRPIFQDLHAVSDNNVARRINPLWWIIALLVLLLAGVYFWSPASVQQTNTNAEQMLAQTVTSEQVVTAPPAAEPIANSPTMTAAPAAAMPESKTLVSTSVITTSAVQPASAPAKPVIKPQPVKPAATVVVSKVANTTPATQTQSTAITAAASQSITDTNLDTSVAIEKKMIPPSAEQIAENNYRLAVQAVQQRQLDDAEKNLKAALASNPRHLAASELLAGIYLDGKRIAEAQQVLEQGLIAQPGQPNLVTLLARIYVEQKNETGAIRLLEQQHQQSKLNPDSLALLAALYQRSARHADAITAFKEALQLRPMEGKWWLGLGISSEAEQNWNDARFAYERVRNTNVGPQLEKYAEQRLAVVRTK